MVYVSEYIIFIGVGGLKVCVIAKLSLSESKREFLYSIFWVSSCEYTTFRVYDSVGTNAYYYVFLWVWDTDQMKPIISMDKDKCMYMVVCLFVDCNKLVCFRFLCFCVVFNMNFYWCNLLIHVVSIVFVRSFWYRKICEKTLNIFYFFN